MELKGKTIAFLGDSITEGVGSSAPDKVYHQLLKNKYGLKAALNFGVSGTRLAKQTEPSDPISFDEDFVKRAKTIPDDIDAVIVFGGTNDYGHGDAPFGAPGDKTNDTFCGACYALMSYLLDRFGDRPIIFMTPLHRADEGWPMAEDGKDKRCLREYVAVIRQTAELFAVPVLDLYSESGMQPMIESNNRSFFVDGLHPNDAGHERIAAKLGAFLENFEV